MSNTVPDSFYTRFGKIVSSDKDTIEFVWDRRANELTSPVRDSFFRGYDDGGYSNPFEYILKSGIIETDSEQFFRMFYSQMMINITECTAETSMSIDVKMKPPWEDEFRYYHIYVTLVNDENNVCNELSAYVRKFSAKEEFEKKVLTFFTSDKNPAIYAQQIKEMVDQNLDKDIAFIQFDIVRFKLINEKYGSDTGDEILNFVSEALKVVCTQSQPNCRLTADVFMVVTVAENVDYIYDFIHLLESRLSGYKGISYRFKFGVAKMTDKTAHTRIFGDHASTARQSISDDAIKNICFYDEKMTSSLQRIQIIEEDMKRALINDEFVMYLQPKYRISNCELIGAEALARWFHKKKGMISPAEFIPVFEKNGFIGKMDRIIWEKACKRIRYWIDSGLKPVPISVNVSRTYLNSNKAIDVLSELIDKYSIPIELLQIEITETAEASGVEEAISDFKSRGFTLLMDDFGTGYSSLNMLKSTPFDVLKIDRSFLSEFMDSDRGRKIISHTISMSHDIGLDIIAEGVETAEQAEFLRTSGCDTAQGFLYSRPVSEEDFDKLLKAKN